MTRSLRPARSSALLLLLSCAALAAWSQAPAEDHEPSSQPPVGHVTLPGTVVERNVFVPVDSTGHTGGEYIVIERRVMKKSEAETGSAEVPTHFILVPQDGDDEETQGDSSGNGGAAPR